jgi:hypothetical protein
MKEENALVIIIRKLLIFVAIVLIVAWFALGIYNPWAVPQDCEYQDRGCQGDNRFGQ